MFSNALFLCSLLLLPATLTAKRNQSCPPYPYAFIEHGTIIPVGRQTYIFHCDKGYFLASDRKVRCYRGNWTSLKEPRCLKKEGLCDDPPAIDNGKILGDDRNIGDKVIYTCKEGFLLMGKAERTCTRSGHWSGRTPDCMDESEPLQNVAERLKHSFVTELGKRTDSSPEGRLLDRASLHQGLELILLLDRSSSVDSIHLEISKDFVKHLIRRFGVRNGANNKSGTRAAVFAFGTDVQLIFNVDNETITGPTAANEAIDIIQPNGGGTNMEGALTQVILRVTPVMRPNAKRALFMMTDGEPNIADPKVTPQDVAKNLKRNYDFEIFTVGIGKGINQRLLADLASQPALSHVFVLEEYTDLNDVMKIIEDTKPEAAPISKDQCGYEGPNEDRPWLVTIYIGGGVLKICGGVLICSQWVLTAASCIEDVQQTTNIQDIFVVLGERNLIKYEANQTNFYVTDLRIHPAFNPGTTLRNNLALLKLNLPAAGYRPACLPPTDRAIPMHLDLNINATITGWGISSSQGPSEANGGHINFTMDSTPVALDEEGACPGKKKGMPLFCAGQGSQTCLGLMGSPLIAVDPATHFSHVIGTLAGRSHCFRAHNQYIQLTKFIVWINRETDGCHLNHWGLHN